MATTSADISTSICSALAFTEPDLDTSIGSTARRIIDAVSGSIAEAFYDQQLTTNQYDIDSKSGGDLDTFVALFGMSRQAAKYASGVVTFTRSAVLAGVSEVDIPFGTQVLAQTEPAQSVQTILSSVMTLNQTTIDVPVRALTPGSAGNISAGLLTTLVSPVTNISASTLNVSALSGGVDAETDEDLRARWKATVFRNLAGTEQMYRAMALQADPSVTAVNILGSRKTWVDRVTITNGTSGPISFGNPAYIYSSGVFLGASIGSLNLASQGTNFTVTIDNTVSPATITYNAVSGGLADNDYDIQYDYVPEYSRNDPFGNRFGSQYVNDRIDVWTTGVNPQQVTQACTFSTSASLKFTSTATADLFTGLFRKLDGTHPSNGDIFLPLAYGPIILVPASITIPSANSGSGTTYMQGVHYDIVHRSDAFGYSPTSIYGLVFYASGTVPANGATFPLVYYYNSVPALIQTAIQNQWRLLGTDCMVHAGIATLYRFHLAVVYTRGFDTAVVDTDIETALSELVNTLGFDSSLQVSDVLQTVHNVPGVDNVRFLNASDPEAAGGDGSMHYAIEPMLPNGNPSTPISEIGGRAADLYFDDASYPLYDSVHIVIKTRSNFGAS